MLTALRHFCGPCLLATQPCLPSEPPSLLIQEGSSELEYYHNPGEWLAKHSALGRVSTSGAEVFAKSLPKESAKVNEAPSRRTN